MGRNWISEKHFQELQDRVDKERNEKIKGRVEEIGLTARICVGMVEDWVDGYCQICRHYFDTPQLVHFGAEVYSLRERVDLPPKGHETL